MSQTDYGLGLCLLCVGSLGTEAALIEIRRFDLIPPLQFPVDATAPEPMRGAVDRWVRTGASLFINKQECGWFACTITVTGARLCAKHVQTFVEMAR